MKDESKAKIANLNQSFSLFAGTIPFPSLSVLPLIPHPSALFP